MAFVADNSVIVAWFVPSQATELTRKAWRLARSEQVHVPAIWQPEFVNVLSVLERRGLLAQQQVDAVIAKVGRLGIEVHDAVPALAPLLELSRRHGIKAYDASYLYLAVSMGTAFYSRDAILRKAARVAGVATP